jgi:enterochelin esterase-like enzyme
LEPDSILLVWLLVLAAAAMLWVLVRYRHLLVRGTAGLLALVLAGTAGVAVVNDYYGYYQTWSQLWADATGSYSAFAASGARSATSSTATGSLLTVRLPGPRTRIDRTGLVYLPPQYFQARYRHTNFPVVELVHGTPGGPWTWVGHVEIVSVMNNLIREHVIGPMVLVMPRTFVGHHYEECVNAPHALDDTYLTQDVRTDVEAKFRVSHVSADWGIAGYSSGGYCAANLALRHPSTFGAAAIMDGYFRPQDGEAAGALHYNPAAEAANDPLLLAAALRRSASPLPAFWVSAGTRTAADLRAAEAFVAALHGVEQVSFFRDPNAGHTFYEWDASIPHVLSWMWADLAPPELRVQFPIAGPIQNEELVPRLIVSPIQPPAALQPSGRGSVVARRRPAGAPVAAPSSGG